MKDILKTLEALELSRQEARLYLLLIEFGSSPVGTLARKGEIKRTNLYNTLEKLSQKGVVSEYQKGHVRYFQAAEPEKLIKIQKQKKRNLEKSIKNLKEILPSLEAIKNPMVAPPKVRYFEGKSGLEKLLDQILTNESFDAYFNTESAYNTFPKVVAGFLESGNQLKLPIREIMVNNKGAKQYIKKIQNPNHHYKLLPKDKMIYTDTLIYGNKVAFISYVGHTFGVVIESEDMVQSQKIAFEMMWNNLK